MKLSFAIRPSRRAAWSYASVGIYLTFSYVSFPGDWLVSLGATYLFIYTRFDICRDCRDEPLKRKYAALGIGYYVFFAFSYLVLPFATLLPLDLSSLVLRYLLVPWTTGLLYLVPATLYLAYLDHHARQPADPASSR